MDDTPLATIDFLGLIFSLARILSFPLITMSPIGPSRLRKSSKLTGVPFLNTGLLEELAEEVIVASLRLSRTSTFTVEAPCSVVDPLDEEALTSNPILF
jgi:hypothetical protein